MIIAFWLEAWLTKQEILSRYLSSVYFGDGVYGLRAAVAPLFQPRAGEPDAGPVGDACRDGPGALAPRPDPQSRSSRRSAAELVLQAMAETGAISAGAGARRDRRRGRSASSRKMPDRHLFRRLGRARRAAQAFDADFGEVKVRDDARPRPPAAGGPRAIDRAPLGDAQAALVAMRPDGEVVAMVGGKSYTDSPFNRATQARRQPGSAFKLFVYLAALRAGWTPDSIIEDKPITIDGWTPVNSDGIYRGQITLREAFARSSNAATVRLSEAGRARQRDPRRARPRHHARRCPNNPSIALGTSGVSLLELTSAYAAVASGRYPVVARGLPDEQPEEGLAAFFRAAAALDRRRDRAPMLDLLYAAANNGTGRRAALRGSDLRQDRHDPGEPRRVVHRLCRRPGGRRVGRARRQQVARQGQRRHRAGADLAQFHGLGARGRPSRRPAAAGRVPHPRRKPETDREEPAAAGLERQHQGPARHRRATIGELFDDR